MPKRTSDSRQVGLVEVCAIAWRLEIHAIDLNVKSIFLRSYDQVRAIAAELAADLVANVGGDGDHGGGNTDAESDRDAGQQLAPFLPPERFVDQASEHGYGWNMRLLAATSASWMITASAVVCALSGTGLHPPGIPTDCGLIGAAQFLQTTPFGPL